MKKLTKAPSVPSDKLSVVAEAATKLMGEVGFKNIFALPAKRTIQWRVKFESAKRASNVNRRVDNKDAESFGVSRNVVIGRIGGEDLYNKVMAGAYEAAGMEYVPSMPTSDVKPTVAVKASVSDKAPSLSPLAQRVKQNRKKANVAVTDDELDAVLSTL